jgi:DNA-binding CsgD family transcriptional regulator
MVAADFIDLKSPPTALIVPRSPARTPQPSFAGSQHKARSSRARPTPCSRRPGHRQPLPKSRRPQHPGGLTAREAEVLRLAARSLTTREIADRLYISAKTADHHIQHVYTKIGVSTRARRRPVGDAARPRRLSHPASVRFGALTLRPVAARRGRKHHRSFGIRS